MGQNIVVTGMVLKVMPIGDYDRRITLLTKERGKITAFAKGARRPKLLYQSLRALTSAAYDKRLVRFIFELKAMAVNGEAPNVFSCVRCGEKENLRWFVTRRGGCICETCEKKDPSPEESGRFLLEESTLYTMQYIISARVEKLYTFSVSDSVLRQLLAIMKSYRAVYLDHSFQTLKMLEGLFTG